MQARFRVGLRSALRSVCLAAALAGSAATGGVAQTTATDPAALPKLDLSPEQRQVVFTSLTSQTHKSTAAPLTFGPIVGANVPLAVETAPLPDTVVTLIPQLRGFEGAVVADQVLIVAPKTKQIVEIITGKK